MPEGDTIRRTADQLRPRLAGKQVTRATPERFQRLVGSTVTDVSPNGKHLLVHFDNGLVLHSHLRMTGSWHVYRPGEPWRRPAHLAKVVLENEDTVAVLFNAPIAELRREKVLEHDLAYLGPDILGAELNLGEVLNRARKAERQALGELLLNQRVAAGIGNIYKCESLWRLRLDPWMLASSLDDEALGRLYLTARTLMLGALKKRPPIAVHGKAGRSCPRCWWRIACRHQGDPPRFTYYCPKCQQLTFDAVERPSDPVRLRERLRENLKVALTARDSIAVAALRSAISAIDNAEAVQAPAPTRGPVDVHLGTGAAEVARRELSAQDVVDVIEAEVRERTAAAAEYQRLGRVEQANKLRAEATALRSYLDTALKEI